MHINGFIENFPASRSLTLPLTAPPMELDPLFSAEFDSPLDVRRGDLLISEPFLNDPNFGRSVILVCEHEESKGSFGLTLNKPTAMTVGEVTDGLPQGAPVYVGGPVERDTLHFVHGLPDLQGAMPLRDGLYWSGDAEHLRELHLQGRLSEGDFRFFVGYSGWGAGQLRGELERKAWTVARLDLSDLLSDRHGDLWSHVLRQKGGKFKMFANYPEDPRLN